MKPLAETIRLALSESLGDSRSEPGIVAVSGGADSVALLRALSCFPVTVAHFNHRLRGNESDGDEWFVRELAASLKLPFEVGSAALSTLASQEKANLEDLARRTRYSFFEQVAAKTGAAWIATGHNADDQAETVLHRLIRGTGLQGLRGIARSRVLPSGLVLVRPMLGVSRSQILRYLTDLNQPHREDATNRDVKFTRNRIRHELLPLLKGFNPEIVISLNRLAEQAEEEFVEREAEADELLKWVRLPSAGKTAVLDASKLAEVSKARIRAILRRLWHLEDWPRRYLNRDHWEEMARIAKGEATAIDLPDGLRMERRGGVVNVGSSA